MTRRARAHSGIGGVAGHLSTSAQGRLSRKAREGAQPQLSRVMLKDKPALYFAVKVAHAPRCGGGGEKSETGTGEEVL
jgi:hypothetical protein